MARTLGDQLREIAYQMRVGILTYEEAHNLARPIVDEMNKKAKAMAKEAGVPFKRITFTHFTR